LSVALALLSAVAYGVSDFLAGVAARRVNAVVVTLLAQAAAAAVSWIALPFTGKGVNADALLWGPVAGVGAWTGTVFLYRGLARGRMSIVGPLSAVFTAAGSAIAGIALGDRPTVVEVAGVVVACAAVALVSVDMERDAGRDARRPAGVLDGALAGGGFTLLFVALNRAGSDAGLWPVVMSQSTGLVLAVVFVAVLVVLHRVRGGGRGRWWRSAVIAGVLGGGATFAYFYATHLGLLTIAAVLTALYPAATVVLAVVVLRERLRRLQVVGLGLAAVSVALLAGCF